MKRMEKTSVLLYCHCAAGVIGLAKSCLLAANSWEKNRHYFYYVLLLLQQEKHGRSGRTIRLHKLLGASNSQAK